MLKKLNNMLKNQRNIKGNQEGYLEIYYSGGQLHSKGNYINNEYHGYWERYNSNVTLNYIEYFVV